MKLGKELIYNYASSKKKMFYPCSWVEQSRKLCLCLSVRSLSSGYTVIYVFNVEVTNNQDFWLKHHLDFQNTMITSGKIDQKKKKNHPLG